MRSCIAVCLQTLLMHICGRVMAEECCTANILLYPLNVSNAFATVLYAYNVSHTTLFAISPYTIWLVLRLMNHESC